MPEMVGTLRVLKQTPSRYSGSHPLRPAVTAARPYQSEGWPGRAYGALETAPKWSPSPAGPAAIECPAAPGAGGPFDPGTDRPPFIPTASNGEDKEDEDLDFYDDDEEDPDLDDDADALADDAFLDDDEEDLEDEGDVVLGDEELEED